MLADNAGSRSFTSVISFSALPSLGQFKATCNACLQGVVAALAEPADLAALTLASLGTASVGVPPASSRLWPLCCCLRLPWVP